MLTSIARVASIVIAFAGQASVAAKPPERLDHRRKPPATIEPVPEQFTFSKSALRIAAEAVATWWNPTAAPGDLDNNGVVNVTDLLGLLASWDKPGPADLDSSGVVDVADLFALLAVWGPHDFVVLDPAPDSRLVHVSSTFGDDAGDGSIERPLRTIAAGVARFRDGHADWLLLRRGDVFDEPFGNWARSGRGPRERIVIAGYGQGPRPLIRTRQAAAFWNGGSFIAFDGLELMGDNGDDLFDVRPNPGRIVESVLWQDCSLHNGQRGRLTDTTGCP